MTENNIKQFMNTDNMSSCLQMLSEDYCKLQMELSDAKLQIISLESQLVSDRELNNIKERNHQRTLQDLEHYKNKKVFEKPVFNLKENNNVDIDLQLAFTKNEQLIKSNFDLTQNINSIEKRLVDLTNQCSDLLIQLSHSQERNNDLNALNVEMKIFITEKKSELIELDRFKSRISELEEASKCDNNVPFISTNINKVNELELKCFNLERANEKLKENHTNLMLLGEENATLSKQNERLKLRLQEFESLNSTKISDISFESTSDISTDRHTRHIERENEILKFQQTQISEQNAELKSKITQLERHLKSFSESIDDYHIMLYDKEQRILVQDKELRCLTKDCQSFKQVLETFTDQSNVDSNSAEMLSRLSNVCSSVEEHRMELQQQYVVLDELTQVIGNHVESLKYSNTGNDTEMDGGHESDREMIVELRNEVERLNQDLKLRTEELKHAEERYRSVVNECRVSQRLDESDDQMSEMGFSDAGVHSSAKDRSRNIFKRLSHNMLETVKYILGYSLQFGPNGHVTCHNCLSNDATESIEFKVTITDPDQQADVDISDSRVTLIDNAYSESIKKQIDYKDNYPALLASITLDLLERSDNSMC